MFGFKKKKQQKNTNNFNGTYVVQDADNIISIAQQYNIPWKELAEANHIDPPYILISGESISVPGEAEEDVSAKEQETHAPQKSVSQQPQENLTKEHEEEVVQQSHDEATDMHVPQDDMATYKKHATTQEDDQMSVQKRTVGTSVAGDNNVPSQESVQKKKAHVQHASPKSMLTQPSSEPTTRAIDIEWMRDDEVAYMEEMEEQEKKTSRTFLVVLGCAIVVVGVLVWYGVSWFLSHKSADTSVSVDALIVEDATEDVVQSAQSEESKDEVVHSDDNTANDNDNTEEVKEENAQNDDEQEIGKEKVDEPAADNENAVEDAGAMHSDTKDVSVQVLNAGAAAGAAGTVTDALEKAGYTLKKAKNAQNSYHNVVIYHKKGRDHFAKNVAEKVDEKYGTQKIEEADDVVSRYGVDVVVVLGA